MNVYDFDNTIYDGESVLDFFLFCLKKKKILIMYLPLAIYTLFLYKLRFLSIEKLYDLVGKMSSVVIDNQKNADSFVQEFWAKNSYKLKPYFLNILKSEDVIITSSPNILIEGIANKLKTKNIISSQFNLKTGTFDFACFRENKLLAFKEKYPNVIINEFYTDSLNDMPLIKISKKAYIVKKNKAPKLIDLSNK